MRKLVERGDSVVESQEAIRQPKVVMRIRWQVFNKTAERITQAPNRPADKGQIARRRAIKPLQDFSERLEWIARFRFVAASPVQLKRFAFALKNQEWSEADERIAPKCRMVQAAVQKKTVRLIDATLKQAERGEWGANLLNVGAENCNAAFLRRATNEK
jgi:hypothetical protein